MKKGVGLLLVLLLLSVASQSYSQIVAYALPNEKEIVRGRMIHVPVIVDMTNSDEMLGSYTGRLSWDPHKLEYVSHSHALALVNDREGKKGLIRFAAANPKGWRGKVKLFQVDFRVVGDPGSHVSLDLDFSAMAAAHSFIDLLPMLKIKGTDKKMIIAQRKP